MLNVAPIFTIVVQISKLRIQVNLDTLIWLEVKLVCWNTWFSIIYTYITLKFIFLYIYIYHIYDLRMFHVLIIHIFFRRIIELKFQIHFFLRFFVFHLVNNIIRISKIYHGRFNVQILNRWKLNLSRAINFKFETR